MMNDNVKPILETATSSLSANGTVIPGWLGSLEIGPSIGLYIDTGLMLIFGGIPWQVCCRNSNRLNKTKLIALNNYLLNSYRAVCFYRGLSAFIGSCLLL